MTGTADLSMRELDDAANDLDSALSDARFLEPEQRKIIYAVDFSEIYAFVAPKAPAEDREDSTEQLAIDLAILSWIFFGPSGGGRRTVLVLPPYQTELRHALPDFAGMALTELRTIVDAAETDVRRLETDPTFRHLLEDFRSRPAAQSDDTALVNYLRANATNLVLAIGSGGYESPQSRLRKLLKRSNLVDLSAPEILGRQVPLDHLDGKLVDRLTAMIVERRIASQDSRRHLANADDDRRNQKGAQSSSTARETATEVTGRRDAIAAAYVLYLNDLLGSSNTRVVLVSRSATFLSAIRELADGDGPSRMRQFVRSPRSFQATLLEPEGPEGGDALARLDQLRRSVEARRKARWQRGSSRSRRLAFAIESLRRQLGAAALVSSDWQAEQSAYTSTIVALLKERDYRQVLNESLAKSAQNLVVDVTMNNLHIAYAFPSASRSGPGVELVSRGRGVPTFVWIGEAMDTLGLYFYHPYFGRHRSEDPDGAAVLRSFVAWSAEKRHTGGEAESGSDRALVEWCLAVSFLEATQRRWSAAQRYADLAANWPEQMDETPRHDALLMQAFTHRKANGVTDESFMWAMGILDRADGSVSGGKDPRLLLERGIWQVSSREQALPLAFSKEDGAPRCNSAIEHFKLAQDLLVRPASPFGPSGTSRQLIDVLNAHSYTLRLRRLLGRHVEALGRPHSDDGAKRLG